MSTAAAHAQDQFSYSKSVQGGLTLLTMRGTLNEQFDGKKLAAAIKTKKVVIQMREVRRFASWGMSQWMDFLRTTADRDLYLVECSTYSVSQLNLVTGLLGHAKLVSFYAAYRCEACGSNVEARFIVPKDRDLIYSLPNSAYECPKCKGTSKLEEYPASFFDTIADRPVFDLDDEVLANLNNTLGYDLAPDLIRFRAHRAVKGPYTYLRLSGSMGTMPTAKVVDAAQGTTVVDLSGIVFDGDGIMPWRSFTQASLLSVKQLQLLNCPVGFIDHAVSPAELRDKVKIRTFALAYECPRCETTVAQMIDVAENLEQLVVGVAPPARCSVCQSSLVPVLSADQSAQLRALPARDRDPALEKFLSKVRSEQADKLENVLVAGTAAPAKPTAPSGNSRTIAWIALGTATVGGLAAAGAVVFRDKPQVVVQGGGTPGPSIDAGPEKPQYTRPEWIVSDVPASSYCLDQINRLMCVGVSSYRGTREDAVAEANDAALEELVNTVGLKVTEPFFREQILTGFSEVRQKALSAMRDADVDRYGPTYAAANEAVRKGRKRVVDVLRISGGAAVPAQRSDWYWEEYAGEKGRGNETLVFVRYDVPIDTVRALVDRYSTPTTAEGTTAMTAFPSLAWQYPDFAGGVIPTKVGKPFARAGVEAKSIITALGEVKIADAPTFARKLADLSGDVGVTVKVGDATPQVVQVKL